MITYTRVEFAALCREQYDDQQLPDVERLVNRWVARGDGAAVYTNEDLGHPELGSIKIVSYGSADAQLEVPSEQLPQRLPDGLPAGAINWRYSLTGVYAGEPINLRESTT